MPFPDAVKQQSPAGLSQAGAAAIPLRPLLKRFALIYLSSVAILTIAILTSISLNAQYRLDRRVERENGRIEIARHLLTQDFSVVNSELRLAANLRLMQRYLDSGSSAQRDELALNFLTLVKETRRYDQARFLDAAGQEIIRVNYNDGHPAIVPREQLQDKSGRYFFRDTIKLNPGEIFVSPLDLNIEHDRLEIPYKPMIRFGMPLFDSAGQRKGILLLNYFGSELLQHFREAMSGGDPRNAMLLNRDGYWLSSSKSGDEWGFMLGKNERSFARDFAGEWRTISTREQGMLQSDKGLFVYATVYPLLAGQRSSTGNALPRAPSRQDLQQNEYSWKIVSFVPHDMLSSGAFYTQPGGRILFLLVYVLLALASAAIAYISLSRKQARTELRENEARLREITSTLSEGLLVMDNKGRITYANPAACTTLGYTEQELLGQDMHDCLHAPQTGDTPLLRSECKILQVMQSGTCYRAPEEAFRCKDGVLLPVSVSAAAIISESGISGIVVAFHDITERKRAELALRKSSEEIEGLYNYAPCGYHSLDKNGYYVKINHTELTWLGYSREEMIGKMRFPDLLTPASLHTFQENFPRFKESGYVHDLEFELLRRDGTILPILLSATAVFDANDQYAMSRSTLFDLTERKKMERLLQLQARTDALTGLINRRHFYEQAELELARARRHNEPLSLLMLDVDHFKSVNDTYGHHTGDVALQKLSEVCMQTFREIDLVARLGGEEFAVLLPETIDARAFEVAERLRLAAAEAEVPLEHGGSIHFTISIGVASFATTDSSIDMLLKRADQAMYQAKKSGRNRVCMAGTA